MIIYINIHHYYAINPQTVAMLLQDQLEVQDVAPKCPPGSVQDATNKCSWCLNGTYSSGEMSYLRIYSS